MREIGVGLLGLGNVGCGVVKLLAENAQAIEARLGARVAVRAIAVRDPDRARLVEVDPSLLTTDVNAVINRDDVEIVCELIGGARRSFRPPKGTAWTCTTKPRYAAVCRSFVRCARACRRIGWKRSTASATAPPTSS